MKKSLIAIAVLGAAAFSAQAANVTLYGTVDAGFAYNHSKLSISGDKVGNTENSFKMADGLDGANKIGIKGEEDLGNMKVGFKLENKFKLSNGDLGDKNKLFQREARMYVKSDLGEIGAGRFGGLASAAGSYDLFFAQADAFDGGDNNIPYAFVTSDRYDNSIAYQSPEIAGFQGTLMYSFQKNGKQEDKMKDNDRYVGAGLTFKQDALSLVGVVEAQIRANDAKNDVYKNGFTYNLGGNYDFGVAQAYAGFQYARHMNAGDVQSGLDMQASDAKKQVDGYAFTLGTKIPFGANKITLGAYYGQYKNAFDTDIIFPVAKKDAKLKIYGLSGRYEYALSKRSTLYAGAGIGQTKLNASEWVSYKKEFGQAYFGLHHNF